MHGPEELTGSHPCVNAEGSHFVSGGAQCVQLAHTDDFGTGPLDDYPVLHAEDTGCPDGGFET